MRQQSENRNRWGRGVEGEREIRRRGGKEREKVADRKTDRKDIETEKLKYRSKE